LAATSTVTICPRITARIGSNRSARRAPPAGIAIRGQRPITAAADSGYGVAEGKASTSVSTTEAAEIGFPGSRSATANTRRTFRFSFTFAHTVNRR